MNGQHTPDQLLRIADANTNRIGEGLRVLEEASRFILNAAALSERLKSIRHEISVRDRETKMSYLSARDSQNDVGAGMHVNFQAGERSLVETVTANARRVEESLRVMEELSATKGFPATGHDYQGLRFKLYEIEKELTGRIIRKDLAAGIYGLYVVVDSDCLKGRNLLDTVSQVLGGGVKLVQLRDKATHKHDLYEMALAVKQLCAENDAVFIVNDHLDIALASGADGLHLGQGDLPVHAARNLLPVDKLIGCSVTTPAEAVKAQDDGADYLACGAVYPTLTKPDCPVTGLEALRAIKNAVNLPLVAIGGINLGNLPEVFAAGADSVAVVSAVVLARSPGLAAREMLERIKECHEQTQ
jgi:thiamine-phosphate pyrophosphorylase